MFYLVYNYCCAYSCSELRVGTKHSVWQHWDFCAFFLFLHICTVTLSFMKTVKMFSVSVSGVNTLSRNPLTPPQFVMMVLSLSSHFISSHPKHQPAITHCTQTHSSAFRRNQVAVCHWEPVTHLFYEPQWEFLLFNTRADGRSPPSVMFIEFVGSLWCLTWEFSVLFQFMFSHVLTCYTLLFEGLPHWINPSDKWGTLIWFEAPGSNSSLCLLEQWHPRRHG